MAAHCSSKLLQQDFGSRHRERDFSITCRL
jgi:hypothetical protein